MSAIDTDLERPRTDAATVQAIEWPTLALVIFAYGGWLALTRAYGEWSTWVVAPSLAVLLTLHSSLQHELLHGHPTRWTAFNRLLGFVPLSLWLPYDRFRTLHLAHHVNDRLTDPLDDPETNYVTPDEWRRRSRLARWNFQLQLTLAGRVLVGSWWRMGGFWASEVRAFVRNDPGVRRAWITHLALCVPVVYWVTAVCGIAFWFYVVAMVVPGNGLLLIRSYAEHRARADVAERTAVVERSWLLGPLFLFNNLHSLHHAEPRLPWYQYHRQYRVRRSELLAANGGLVYRNYFDLAGRFLFRMHDQPQHPLGRAPDHRVVTR
jgi:fatty acid desaturase